MCGRCWANEGGGPKPWPPRSGLNSTSRVAVAPRAQFITEENLEDSPQHGERRDRDSQPDQTDEALQPDHPCETEYGRAGQGEPDVAGNAFPQANGFDNLKDSRHRGPAPYHRDRDHRRWQRSLQGKEAGPQSDRAFDSEQHAAIRLRK